MTALWETDRLIVGPHKYWSLVIPNYTVEMNI